MHLPMSIFYHPGSGYKAKTWFFSFQLGDSACHGIDDSLRSDIRRGLSDYGVFHMQFLCWHKARLYGRASRRALGSRHRAPRSALVPCDGERPSPPACRSRPAKLGAAGLAGTRQPGGKQPRQRRDGPVPPDGSGPASETGRCTRGTSVRKPLKRIPPARTWRIWAGLRCAPVSSGELPRRLMSPAGRPRRSTAA